MINEKRIAFVGCGNMSYSLIGGLIANKVNPQQITASDPNDEQREIFSNKFGVCTYKNNNEAIDKADIIVFAVKPQLFQGVASELATSLKNNKRLIISIAAGIKLASIKEWLGSGKAAVVRAMPNTPSLIQVGATALYANDNTSSQQKNIAETILRSVGVVIWLKNESLIDTVTALSGSGPAYFFYIMEALEKGAIEMGLTRQEARLLITETAIGAAKMVLLSEKDPAVLRKQVSSAGGTTEKAIEVFDKNKLEQTIIDAMVAAKQRSIELSENFAK